jgi:hypothetical protein
MMSRLSLDARGEDEDEAEAEAGIRGQIETILSSHSQAQVPSKPEDGLGAI